MPGSSSRDSANGDADASVMGDASKDMGRVKSSGRPPAVRHASPLTPAEVAKVDAPSTAAPSAVTPLPIGVSRSVSA